MASVWPPCFRHTQAAPVHRDPALPIALNTKSGVSPWPVPVVVVGGAWAQTLTNSTQPVSVTLELSGTIVSKVSAPLVHAVFEANSLAPTTKTVVVDTGVSGWSACGGERG